jgi:hypothetical protein
VLNIANCERTEFVLALKGGETAGTRVETWPPKVRALLEESVNCWIEEHKEAHAVRAMTVAAPKHSGVQCCVVILHHVRKGSYPGSRPAPQDDNTSEAARHA